jgi:uncharacterized protein YdhG (YjbR/CyaY superfamily)
MGTFCSIARMNKVKAGRRKVNAKRKGVRKTLEEYVGCVPSPARSTFTTLRQAVRSAVPPQATETMSYGIPAFKHNGMLVWFAAFSKHCSLFPTASVIEAFKNELQGYTISKGTIQFPLDKPLPTGLIKKIVRARVAQNESKKRH